MTKKLYDIDNKLDRFTAEVISVTENKGKIEIITDESAFFPEGGGQTCDKGTLCGMTVSHVSLRNGEIVHVIAPDDYTTPLSVGMTVEGEIDMKKRFSDMQQHSGEHIVSGIMHRIFGCDNVGFHLGTEVVTLDFNVQPTAEQMQKVELLANKAVWDNIPIEVFYPTREEAAALPYRSKKEVEGALRLVKIEGIDLCACCAPHVARTGEIGYIRFVNCENYKGGIRLSILCGERALIDCRAKLSQNSQIGSLLSAKEHETFKAAERLLNEKDNLARQMVELRRQLISYKAESIAHTEKVVYFEQSTDSSHIRELAIALKEKAQKFSAVFGCDGECAVKYAVCAVDSDAREIGKLINENFAGRGGGKTDMVQGTLNADVSAVTKFFETLD